MPGSSGCLNVVPERDGWPGSPRSRLGVGEQLGVRGVHESSTGSIVGGLRVVARVRDEQVLGFEADLELLSEQMLVIRGEASPKLPVQISRGGAHIASDRRHTPPTRKRGERALVDVLQGGDVVVAGEQDEVVAKPALCLDQQGEDRLAVRPPVDVIAHEHHAPVVVEDRFEHASKAHRVSVHVSHDREAILCRPARAG